MERVVAEKVKEAHRRVMVANHPDAGGIGTGAASFPPYGGFPVVRLREAFVVFAGPMQVEIALQRDRQNMDRRYVKVFRCYKHDYYHAVAAKEEGAYEVHVSPPRAGPYRAKSCREKEKLEYTEMRGLPYSANKPQIIEFFSGYKVVEGRVHVVCRPDGKATGEAFVEFEIAKEARSAMAKDKMSIGPRYVELFPTTREEARRARSRQ
ncbi:LOW QUALITY PROTEIN: hypothetical protein YC2023_073760 [Brassica napus]